MSALEQQIEGKIRRLNELKRDTTLTAGWWMHQLYKHRPDLHEQQTERYAEIRELEGELDTISISLKKAIK